MITVESTSSKAQQLILFSFSWEHAYRAVLEIFAWEVEVVEASIFSNNRTFIGKPPVEEGWGKVQYCFRELNREQKKDQLLANHLEQYPQQIEFFGLAPEEFESLAQRCDLFLYRYPSYKSLITKSEQRIEIDLAGSFWGFFKA